MTDVSAALPTQSRPPRVTVTQTAATSLGVGTALVVARWVLKHPIEWPPPDDVLTIGITALAPMGHLIYAGIYNLMDRWVNGPKPLMPMTQLAAPAPVQPSPPLAQPPAQSAPSVTAVPGATS